MPLYTLETDRTPILVVAAVDAGEARAICDSSMEELQDLGVFRDGKDVVIRDADEDERAYWDAAIAEAVEEGDVDSPEQAEEESHMVLLIPLADGEDDPEDEDG